mmetsp:Transcript_24820/g.46985  ORF Transcript_24820/g.46985 Transcript_24820/m.46985 type:complete len:217 (-) Transcript_24820:1371-2021(-)
MLHQFICRFKWSPLFGSHFNLQPLSKLGVQLLQASSDRTNISQSVFKWPRVRHYIPWSPPHSSRVCFPPRFYLRCCIPTSHKFLKELGRVVFVEIVPNQQRRVESRHKLVHDSVANKIYLRLLLRHFEPESQMSIQQNLHRVRSLSPLRFVPTDSRIPNKIVQLTRAVLHAVHESKMACWVVHKATTRVEAHCHHTRLTVRGKHTASHKSLAPFVG